ncbi:MAG TPA: DUF3179 domain-containing (seleno)protein, partial [Longimicrobiales bacterium]|nr:DUF3179 domain-containing (seleno)protein [Longimicrobiales bacterium]
TAVAFDRRVDGVTLTFEWTGAGFRDRETGTTWDFAGRATDGPRAGDQLALVESAYVAFWFAWRHFEPDSRTFEAPS